MMKSILLTGALAVCLAVSLPIADAFADKRGGHRHHHGAKHVSEHGHDSHKHSDTGIAVAVGAATLLAIAAAAKAHEGSDSYGYHQGFNGKDNAISACLHKAQRRTVKRGGFGVSLRGVRKVRRTSGGWRVRLQVKQRLPLGKRNVVAVCTVSRGQVQSFAWR